jgi:nucleoside-diphosphate-sugar epimerase
MRALVTGSSGFVGRHMAAELRSRGWDVVGPDLVDGNDALDHFARADDTFGLVVHAAASEPHRAAIDGDGIHMIRNLELDSAMFGWAIRTGTPVLYLSSSAVYPVGLQAGHAPYRLAEEDAADRPVSAELLEALGRMAPLGPDAAYGWTKLTGEKMAKAASEHVPVHVVRPFSGYGEDQDERFPFGAFVARARRREDPFAVWGDGTQVRDWIHIDDVVRGALAHVALATGDAAPVNLCTGVGTSMRELVEMVCGRAGYSPDVKLMPDKPAGVAYRVGDPTLMSRAYVPTVGLAEGVARAL